MTQRIVEYHGYYDGDPEQGECPDYMSHSTTTEEEEEESHDDTD